MAIKELLAELSEATGVSGHEDPVRRIVMRELSQCADEVYVSRLGSVVAIKRAAGSRVSKDRPRSRSAPIALLEAHMDEIGLIVTTLDRGFVRFTQIGGFDPRVLPAQCVIVHGRKELPGVIAARPPHVLDERERNQVTPLSELFIDVGLTDSQLNEMVSVGDIITIDRRNVSLRNGVLAGKAFDDRASVVALIEAMWQLRSAVVNWDVFAVANVQEEAGADFAGAATTAYEVHPNAAVAVDVSHADQPGGGEVNTVPLDRGPGIAFGPQIHPSIHRRLIQVAEKQEVPHRVTTYSRATGTDAWAIQTSGEGIPTGLIDVPLRYMHSSVETVAVADLERTSRLLAAFAESLDEEFLGEVSARPWVQTSRRIVERKTEKPRRRKRGPN